MPKEYIKYYKELLEMTFECFGTGIFTSVMASSNTSAYTSAGSIIGDCAAIFTASSNKAWTSGWSAVTSDSDVFLDVSSIVFARN